MPKRELHKRQTDCHKQSKISAKKLAEFLSSVEAQEVLLEQRLHDVEIPEVFRVIDGGNKNEKAELKIPTDTTTHKSNILSIPSSTDNIQLASDSSETLVVYEEF